MFFEFIPKPKGLGQLVAEFLVFGFEAICLSFNSPNATSAILLFMLTKKIIAHPIPLFLSLPGRRCHFAFLLLK